MHLIFDEKIKGTDFILTGEGKSDKQTLMGKVPEGILKRARKQGKPVHLLSGTIEDEAELKQAGFAFVRSIIPWLVFKNKTMWKISQIHAD